MTQYLGPITSDEIPRNLLRDREIIKFRVVIRFDLTPAVVVALSSGGTLRSVATVTAGGATFLPRTLLPLFPPLIMINVRLIAVAEDAAVRINDCQGSDTCIYAIPVIAT